MRKGPERLFVLVQRLLPKLVDRAIAAQMADKRVRAYLEGLHPAAKARAAHRTPPDTDLKEAKDHADAVGTRPAAKPVVRPVAGSANFPVNHASAG